MSIRRLYLPGWLLGLAFAALAQPSAAMNLVPASDPCFRYEGRVDRSNPAQAGLIWSGSGFRAEFTGGRLALVFGTVTDQAVFNVTVDDTTEVLDLRHGPRARYDWPRALDGGRHRLRVFKRSEAAKGDAFFAGLELAEGGAAFAPPAEAARMKFEFFGDSITAGACNEDGAVDQWDDFRPHNHALSYAHLTSEALGAEHRAMAVSGMGIVIGWVDAKAREVWNGLYPRPQGPRADLTAWQPDVAFVNLGENDSSFTHEHKLPFPADFTPRYVELVKAIRGAYPRATIVLLRGGMEGGAKNPELIAAWTAAVRELEQADPHVTHFVFQHWSKLHPRVSDDRAMSAELVAWLRAQPWLPAASH